MQQIGELLKSLKLDNSQTIESYRIDRANKPAKIKCPSCNNDTVDWFWLESECPEILPSQWKPHLCRCMILRFLRGRRVMMVNNLNLLTKRADREAETEIKETKVKVLLINKTIKAVEGVKDNEEYYKLRVELADDAASFETYGDLVWLWLFDCSSKEETDFYLEVLRIEGEEKARTAIAMTTNGLLSDEKKAEVGAAFLAEMETIKGEALSTW